MQYIEEISKCGIKHQHSHREHLTETLSRTVPLQFADPFPPPRAVSRILARGGEEKEFPRGGIHRRDGTRNAAGFWLGEERIQQHAARIRRQPARPVASPGICTAVWRHLRSGPAEENRGHVRPKERAAGRKLDIARGARGRPMGASRVLRSRVASPSRRQFPPVVSRPPKCERWYLLLRGPRPCDLLPSHLPCVNARFRSGRLPNSNTMACNRAAKSGFAAEAQRKVRVARQMDQMDQMDPADPLFSPRAALR